jgi:hypothetical protein
VKRLRDESLIPALLLVVVLLLWRDVLFAGGGSRIASAPDQDLQAQFIPWRQWGFDQLRHGNVPLWNPHTFCGMPFVGMLQSAMFYPPNLLYLALPIGHATNWTIALHLWLAGVLCYAWARRRGVSRIGSGVAGVTYMLGAPYALHVLPGHVPFLCVAAWAPLVFLVADALLERPTTGWALLGTFAVSMQILGGYPQPAYIAALAGTLYLALNLLRPQYRERGWKHATAALASWIAIYLAAAMISAVQLGPAMAASAESWRSARLDFETARGLSIPLTNLPTLLVPGLWGDGVRQEYAGDSFIWEAIPYVGAVALGLAIGAAIVVPRKRRRFEWTVAIVFTLIALGSQTPLFRFVYDLVPGGGRFRVSGRYFHAAAPMLAVLAGMGWDALRAGAATRLRASIVPTAFAGFAIAAVILAGRIDTSTWGRWLRSIPGDYKYHQFDRARTAQDNGVAAERFIDDSARFATRQFRQAALVLGLFALLALATMFWRPAAYAIALLALAEMCRFSVATHATCDVHAPFPQPWAAAVDSAKGDRVLCVGAFANRGMLDGFDNVWGYDPLVLRRTGEFIAYGQGMRTRRQLDELSDVPVFSGLPPRCWMMLRCAYAWLPAPDEAIRLGHPPMDRLKLIGSYELLSRRDQALPRLYSTDFEPRVTAVIESQPNPPPQGIDGSVRLITETSDALEIEADVPRATLLLVTDAYSTGWRIRPIKTDHQSRYEILPANWMLRAVPLEAGKHHFVMEYSPWQWRVGKWMSGLGLLGYATMVASALRSRVRNKSGFGSTVPPLAITLFA